MSPPLAIELGNLYSYFGIVAVLASGSVVLTGFMFPRNIAHYSKPFSHVIFMISVCDFLGSFGCALGLPHNNSPSCAAQAFLELYFLPASWIWTCILVFQIRCVITRGKLWLKPIWCHGFVWTLVSLTTLLPLTTNPYGQDDDLDGLLPCNFGGNAYIGYVWSIVSVAGLLIACVTFIVGISIEVGWFFYSKKLTKNSAYVKSMSIFKSTRLYPIFMIVCWMPYLVNGLFVVARKFHLSTLYGFSLIMTSQYGTFTALIFFTKCSAARRHWRQLFCGQTLAEMAVTETSRSKSASEGVIVNKDKINFNAANPLQVESSSNSSTVVEPISRNNILSSIDIGVTEEDFDDERLFYIAGSVSNISESNIWTDSWQMRPSDDPSSHAVHV